MLNFIVSVIIGGLAGWIAGKLMNAESSSAIINIILGVCGSVVGGVVFKIAGLSIDSGFSLGNLAASVIGACIIIAIGRAIKKK